MTGLALSHDFALRQLKAWASPPVDDAGYLSSEGLMSLTGSQLKELVEGMHEIRYNVEGSRNWKGRWRDLMGLDEPGEGRTVMDFGCGNGVETLELARAGYEVIVADIVPMNLRLAQRVLGLYGFDAEWTPVHMTAPYIRTHRRLDVFYASGVLHHIPWARAIMEEAHALLVPDGEARLMLYSDVGWREVTGAEPPEDVTSDEHFEKFVREFDAVGEYADWYNLDKLCHWFGDLFEVERCEYLREDRFYLGARLRKVGD